MKVEQAAVNQTLSAMNYFVRESDRDDAQLRHIVLRFRYFVLFECNICAVVQLKDEVSASLVCCRLLISTLAKAKEATPIGAYQIIPRRLPVYPPQLFYSFQVLLPPRAKKLFHVTRLKCQIGGRQTHLHQKNALVSFIVNGNPQIEPTTNFRRSV